MERRPITDGNNSRVCPDSGFAKHKGVCHPIGASKQTRKNEADGDGPATGAQHSREVTRPRAPPPTPRPGSELDDKCSKNHLDPEGQRPFAKSNSVRSPGLGNKRGDSINDAPKLLLLFKILLI